MATYRDIYRYEDENMGWCYPLSCLGGRVILAVNELSVSGIQIDGENLDVNIENTVRAVNLVADGWIYGKDYTMDDSCRLPFELLREILVHDAAQKLPCRKCPWFEVCDALDDQCGEDDEEEDGG